jgi:ABC-2 type transport system permease protein
MVSITFVLALSMIALFIQEAQSVFELYYFPMLFLSGQLFPVSMMPDWVRSVAVIFPFYYTTGVPTEVCVGKLSPGEAHQMIGIQVAWIVCAYLAQRVLWKFGLRAYTAVGM